MYELLVSAYTITLIHRSDLLYKYMRVNLIEKKDID